MDKTRRATRICFALAGVMLVTCPVLMQLFAHSGGAFFPAYRSFSRAWISLLAHIMAIAPFALWDTGALVLIIVALAVLVRCIRRRQGIALWFSLVALVVAWSAFSFTAGWALNHYAPPLASEIGLETHESSVEELAAATQHYLEEAARLAPQVPRDADGTLIRQDFFELAGIAGTSYAELGQRYEIFQGPELPVKALLVWGPPLLYSGHTGIFWAPTGESGVPLDTADADQPFIMCHEAAHRLGLADEREANFAAFLACASSDDARLAYSGYYNAFAYCLNALAAADRDRAQQVLDEVAATELYDGAALVFADRAATREHYDRYEGPFEDVGTAVNDSYLRSFGQEQGVKSYGLVVDYLIAWYEAGDSRGVSPVEGG